MTRRNRWTAALCLALLLFGGHRLLASEPERQSWAEIKTRMETEGWKEIAPGVFERRTGATKVEHLGIGREGLAWHAGKLTRQLEAMMLEYESYPSKALAQEIDNLSALVARSRKQLRNMPEGLSSATAAFTSGCSTYNATADAYHRTDVQGVAAVADASFSNTCGHSGDTYAYAYARATTNATTTTVEQENPRTGTSVTSHAAASAAGASAPGLPCYSSANSYTQSYTAGISYSASDTNSLCPPPASPGPSVTIVGSDFESFNAIECRSVTWTSTVSGGTSPYTYQWKYNGTNVGTGSSYTRSVCSHHQDFTLSLTITDSTSTTAFDDHYVYVFREF